MDSKVSYYIDVETRALELGCDIPNGLTILPRNFESAQSKDELIHEDATVTIRSIWRQANVQETRLEGPGKKFPSIQEKSIEWIAPTIFISGSLLTQNSIIINLALNVLSSYVVEFFRGIPGKHEITLNFVTDDLQQNGIGEKRQYRHLQIKGEPQEINSLDVEKLKHLLK